MLWDTDVLVDTGSTASSMIMSSVDDVGGSLWYGTMAVPDWVHYGWVGGHLVLRCMEKAIFGGRRVLVLTYLRSCITRADASHNDAGGLGPS